MPSSRMTQSLTQRGHQILSHLVHLLLLALHATSSTRKQMGLPFHPAAKQEMFDAWAAMSRQPRAVVEEAGRSCQALRCCSHFRAARQTACALCVLPTPNVPGGWRCQPQVQMAEMGLISLGIYLEKNLLLIISRYLQRQDRTCSRLHPSCLLCSTTFFDASPYHTFIV